MKIINLDNQWFKLDYRIDPKDQFKKDKITLIQQFFINTDKMRNIEIQYCLKKNLENEYIDEILLLNEKIYSDEELGIDKMNNDQKSKIIQINIKFRLTYKLAIDYVKNNNLSGYIILSNSDIYLDETIKNIFKTSLYFGNCWYAQLRFEAYTKQIWENGKIGWAQDTWIFHTNCKIKDTSSLDFNMGRLGCDNVIAYEIAKRNIYIYNDPYFIKTWHLHKSQNRDYSVKDTIPPPWLIVKPVL